MGLETMHDHEFYLARAGEHELLEQVVAGETTLTNHLDDLVAQFKPSTGFFASSDGSQLMNHFSAYVKMLAELSEVKLELSDYKKFGNVRFAVYLVSTYPLGYALGILFVALGTPLGLAVLCGGGATVLYNKLLKKVGQPILKKKRAEVLEPVYELSSQLDADIGRCFLLDHFRGAPKRFERTYRSLSGEEREEVDAQLYGLLGAGGMPGVDEQQLREYLSGLSEPEE